MTSTLDVDGLLADPGVRILLCCGAGGVGKTTTAAALALRAAEQGRRVVVLTIDPARRLAQSLGITQLDNTPRRVAGIEGDGTLDAMMLDMKRTFDDVVTGHASPQVARQVLDNPFYQALSTSFSGTQEYMAMEKLGQLDSAARRDGIWDLIVVDTPPSRSALDFLDAPDRLAALLDGKLLRLLLAPARGPFKVMSVGVHLVLGAMGKILGSQVLTDVQAFVGAFDSLFGGFRARADATKQTLASAEARFVVVTAPEPGALREAAFFVRRLQQETMPLAGLVVNRVHRSDVELSPASAEDLAASLGDGEQAHVARVALARHARLARLIEAERAAVAGRDPVLVGTPSVEVPALDGEVSDLTSLRLVAGLLAVGAPAAGASAAEEK